MRRILSYLKPYRLYILLASVLVFFVAGTNLALPDYLSRIVNIGIQQHGIDSGVPQALRKSSMEKLELLQDENSHVQVLQHYQLIQPSDPAAQSYLKKYPELKNEAIYVLNPKLSKDEKSALENLLSAPLQMSWGLQIFQDDPERIAQFGGAFPLKAEMLPPGTDVFAFLKAMPEGARTELVRNLSGHLSSLGETVRKQFLREAISAEYTAMGVDPAGLQSQYILKTGGVMLLISVLALFSGMALNYFSARAASGVARDLRSAVFHKVQSFSSAEFNQFSTASLITRTSNDVNQVQMMVFMFLRMAMLAPVMGGLGVVRALGKSPNMWWTIALAVVLILGFIILLFSLLTPKFKQIQGLLDRLTLVIRENLSGMMVVRAFNKQEHEQKRFDYDHRNINNNMLFVGRAMSFMWPTMSLIMTGASVFVLWIGAKEVATASLQVGDLMAFTQYTTQILMSFLNLSMLIIFLPRAAVSADRIADVLYTPNSIRDPQNPESLPEALQGRVEFNHVSFHYPDSQENVLHDINFTASPGQTTAIIGSTGSGKSSLVNLIPRFYEISEGSIMIDGVDLRQVKQQELRTKIGYAPQKGLLFSGTIRSNLQVGKLDATEEEMNEAIRIAQAADFVFDKPEGLDQPIAQAGANLSGGQKQRLSIARAIVRKLPIYIFDDSFSALDFKTDSALRAALRDRTAESTVLIVTQRVSTARAAEQILVLDNGQLVGKGKHDELMRTCATYQEIAYSQLSAEELA